MPDILVERASIGGTSLDIYWLGDIDDTFNDLCNWFIGSLTRIEVPCQSPRSSDDFFDSRSIDNS